MARPAATPPPPPAAPPPAAPPPSQPPPDGYALHESLQGNGSGGITQVKAERIEHVGVTTLFLPLIYISSSWYGVHGGCGNGNGQNSCEAICETLDLGELASDFASALPCESGTQLHVLNSSAWYAKGYDADAAAIAPQCTYRKNGAWTVPYSTMPGCYNPMYWCSCTGQSSDVPPGP